MYVKLLNRNFIIWETSKVDFLCFPIRICMHFAWLLKCIWKVGVLFKAFLLFFRSKIIENELPRKPAVLFQLRLIDVLYQYCWSVFSSKEEPRKLYKNVCCFPLLSINYSTCPRRVFHLIIIEGRLHLQSLLRFLVRFSSSGGIRVHYFTPRKFIFITVINPF